jgi:hypothetical protein
MPRANIIILKPLMKWLFRYVDIREYGAISQKNFVNAASHSAICNHPIGLLTLSSGHQR